MAANLERVPAAAGKRLGAAVLDWLASLPVLLVTFAVGFTLDRNGSLRGQPDSAAKTLVFDVNDGRNPITSGGIQGPSSFAPVNLSTVPRVASPVAGAAKPPQAVNAPAPVARPPVQPSAPQPYTAPPSCAPPSFGSEPYAPPSSTPLRAPHALTAATAVPAPRGQAGEQEAQLLSFNDPGTSISKTHLHLLTDCPEIWVTDRNSTNGNPITTPDGRRTPRQPCLPASVSPGSTVHFGDRSFHLGQA